MPPKPPTPDVSDTEQTVLKVLWDRGQLTVREVLDALREQGNTWAYTTVQTLLVRLQSKGLLESDRSGTAHVYKATLTRDEFLQGRLNDLATEYCDGSVSPLMLALVEGGRLSAEDLSQLRDLVERLQNEQPEPKKRRKS